MREVNKAHLIVILELEQTVNQLTEAIFHRASEATDKKLKRTCGHMKNRLSGLEVKDQAVFLWNAIRLLPPELLCDEELMTLFNCFLGFYQLGTTASEVFTVADPVSKNDLQVTQSRPDVSNEGEIPREYVFKNIKVKLFIKKEHKEYKVLMVLSHPEGRKKEVWINSWKAFFLKSIFEDQKEDITYIELKRYAEKLGIVVKDKNNFIQSVKQVVLALNIFFFNQGIHIQIKEHSLHPFKVITY